MHLGHPDDESFGPATAVFHQRRQGHEVDLLALTRDGATRERPKYGHTTAEMGALRFGEMQNVAKALDLSGMTVLVLEIYQEAHDPPLADLFAGI